MTVDDVLNDLQESGIEVKSIGHRFIQGGLSPGTINRIPPMYVMYYLRFNSEWYLRVLNEVGDQSLLFSVGRNQDDLLLIWPTSMLRDLSTNLNHKKSDVRVKQCNWSILLKALKRMFS